MKVFVKNFISIALAVVLIFAVIFTLGCGNEQQTVITDETKYKIAKQWNKEEVYTYFLSSVGKNVMPVSGFGGPYTPSGITYNGHVQPDFNDDKYWQLLKDCGVNNIVFAWNEYRSDTDAIMRALSQAEKFGISYFVRDNYMAHFYNGNKTLEEVIEPYISHPGCAGVFGKDEPPGNEIEMYAKLVNEFYSDSRYTGKDVYLNLLPNYASTAAFGKYQNYEDYIRGFMAECNKIPYLSYDYYPFRTATHNLDNMNAANYFKNLAFIRQVAEDNQVPFWAYYCVGELADAEYPVYPTKEAYFWNINTLLLYGAKGLSLYSVIQSPVDEDLTDAAADRNEGKNYMRFGLIGAIGNVNRWYYYQKEFNEQLSLIDEYLMNARNIGVIGVGNRAKYLGEGEEVIASGSFRELKGVTANESLVGCFDYEGSTMLYVLNNDIESKQKITLDFDDKYGYDVYQRGTVVSVAGKNLSLILEAGEAALVKLRTY